MLTLSDEAAAAVAGSWVMHTRVESWRAGALLADVPIVGGIHETDRSLRIPDRVTLTVPRVDGGVDWDPDGDPDHPLAWYGQRVRVSIGVGLAHGRIEWIQRGWFLITDADARGDIIHVTASNMLALIEEARFAAPFQPTGTFVSTLRALVEPALTVDVTAAPDDRTVPAAMTWDEDRLGAVNELLDAWPAEATISAQGALAVTAPATPSRSDPADITLTSSDPTTLISAGGKGGRSGAATLVVARGTSADGTSVQGVAEDTTGGPLSITSQFNPLPVPSFFFSPLLATVDQCRAAAVTALARRRRDGAHRIGVEGVPHPAVEVGDLASLDAPHDIGVIEHLILPLTPDDGQIRADVRVIE